MAKTSARPFDLFDHVEIEDARAEVERAEKARNEADRRLRFAPHGTVKARSKAYLDATKRVLEAENLLRRLLREAAQ
jgi:hypothetical protein